jgi:hypothetical protein
MAWIRASARVTLGPLYLPVMPTTIRPIHFPPLKADFWVDVRAYTDTARAALACHVSQGGDTAQTQALLDKRWSYFGAQRGLKAAEGFCRCLPMPE